MACGGCAARAQAMKRAAQAVLSGQSPRPAVSQFVNATRNDVQRAVRALNPRIMGQRSGFR
jgi:hypothetical protein